MAEETEKDDRTEEPTQKKLEDAFRKGDVPKSQELNTLFVLAGLAPVYRNPRKAGRYRICDGDARIPDECASGARGWCGIPGRGAQCAGGHAGHPCPALRFF